MATAANASVTNQSAAPGVSFINYVPVVGFFFAELNATSKVNEQIQKLVVEEHQDAAKTTLRTPQLIDLINQRIHLVEAGQIRSLISIALCVACVAIAPHSILVGVAAGVLGASFATLYWVVRNSIAADRVVILKTQNLPFGKETLKELRLDIPLSLASH